METQDIPNNMLISVMTASFQEAKNSESDLTKMHSDYKLFKSILKKTGSILKSCMSQLETQALRACVGESSILSNQDKQLQQMVQSLVKSIFILSNGFCEQHQTLKNFGKSIYSEKSYAKGAIKNLSNIQSEKLTQYKNQQKIESKLQEKIDNLQNKKVQSKIDPGKVVNSDWIKNIDIQIQGLQKEKKVQNKLTFSAKSQYEHEKQQLEWQLKSFLERIFSFKQEVQNKVQLSIDNINSRTFVSEKISPNSSQKMLTPQKDVLCSIKQLPYSDKYQSIYKSTQQKKIQSNRSSFDNISTRVRKNYETDNIENDEIQVTEFQQDDVEQNVKLSLKKNGQHQKINIPICMNMQQISNNSKENTLIKSNIPVTSFLKNKDNLDESQKQKWSQQYKSIIEKNITNSKYSKIDPDKTTNSVNFDEYTQVLNTGESMLPALQDIKNKYIENVVTNPFKTNLLNDKRKDSNNPSSFDQNMLNSFGTDQDVKQSIETPNFEKIENKKQKRYFKSVGGDNGKVNRELILQAKEQQENSFLEENIY